MHIRRITNVTDLQPYRQQWDELARDCIFRSWAWQTTWWQHYSDSHRLCVLLVLDEDANCRTLATCSDTDDDDQHLIAIFPGYLESNFVRGRTLRLLGDGEVCSDHLDLLAAPTDTTRAAKAVAKYLYDHTDDWDTTNFTAVGANSTGLAQLSDKLHDLGCQTIHEPNESCWSIPLPDDWDGFLALQSKSHRKQLRQLERRILDTEQAVWHLVKTPTDFEIAWPILTDLHQRRRISLGQPGCFASQRWANFHRDIAGQMLADGKLRLSWLELAGQPVAAEYHFASQRTTWAYQGGVDPDRIDQQPGRLSMIRTFQHAIAEGHQQFDLLRGDEPYKAHWRAEPKKTFDIQIVSPRSVAVLRSRACNYLHRAVRLARHVTNMLG